MQGAGPGGDRGPDAGPGPGERRGPGGPGLPFLRGIELTEAQEDRLFAILHAQAPQLREQDKIEDKAHEALRVRTAGQVMALLTPEQRAQIKRGDESRAPR